MHRYLYETNLWLIFIILIVVTKIDQFELFDIISLGLTQIENILYVFQMKDY